MTEIKLSTMLSAVAIAGSALILPVATAPIASANCNANQQWDPINSTCWTKQDRNAMGTAQGSNGCRPGQLGNCLGALQNGVTPGANLPDRASTAVAEHSGARIGSSIGVQAE